ncbi:MAG: efflux transporter protein [Deltaproteobacteria bacterium]|jgi:tripartite-type tricarboxylate transporter receptor subunit TctC|nr:efflux transporter protein [Deltaproteobacteria bacterium]
MMPRRAFPFLLVLLWSYDLPAQTPYYQGKTIRLVAGTPAGSVYDTYARLMAQFMPKYIPGTPNIIVQNMPGVASMVAANYIYTIAKPDGLTIGAIQPALYFDQLVGRKEVQFDWQKFSWIGNTTVSHHLLYIRADAPYKNIEDIRKSSVAPKCGSEGTASSAYYIPKLLEETLGSKFNVVTGYNAGTEVDLAVERGEVQCRAFTIAAFFAREPFHTWRKKGFVRVLIQTGKKRDANLPDVPSLHELMDQYKTQDSSRRLANVILAANEIGRPIVGTPGIPAERVKILRDAFTKAVNDQELVEEAKKKRLELDPVSGEDLQTLASEIMAQPPEVVERMKKLLGT